MHSLPAITLAVICLSGAAATSGTVVEHVDCAAVAGSHTTAIQATLASINESCSSYTALGGPAPDALIRISGPCLLDRSIRVYGRHACRSISLQGNTPSELLSGGLPVYASWFAPVTDAGILSQITSPAARSAVVELNLTEHAITNLGRGPGPISGRGCRAYAEGLPEPHGGSMPGASINSPPGLELFAWAGKGTLPAPLTLARWPNYPWQPQNWSTVVHTFSGPLNRTFNPDNVTAHRLSAWLQQLEQTPGSINVHEYDNVGWADMHWSVLGANVANGRTQANLTFGGCGNMSVGEHAVKDGNYYYVYNVLAEIDEPGEYTVNRSSGMLYLWPPTGSMAAAIADFRSGSTADVVVGAVSQLEEPVIDVHDTANVSLGGLSIYFGRGPGVLVNESSDVVISNSDIRSIGLMAINVSESTRILASNVTIDDTGNGGVYMYAGDRNTLTPGLVQFVDGHISNYNRWTHCYTPGVVLGGVGNTVRSSEVFNAPHQGIFLSGNNHVIESSDFHDLVRITKDAGAFYFGRDLTYRGNMLVNNSWHGISSVWGPPPVLYADDCASSMSVINNSFWNNSGDIAALEGGKNHVFTGNIAAPSQHTIHALSKGCAGALAYLDLVPWNTSAVWLSAYPELVPEVAQNPNAAWGLVFVGNTFCNATSPAFVDMSNASLAKLNGTEWGNVISC